MLPTYLCPYCSPQQDTICPLDLDDTGHTHNKSCLAISDSVEFYLGQVFCLVACFTCLSILSDRRGGDINGIRWKLRTLIRFIMRVGDDDTCAKHYFII